MHKILNYSTFIEGLYFRRHNRKTSYGLKQYLNDYSDVLVFEMQVLCGIFVHLLKMPKIVEPLLRLRSEEGMGTVYICWAHREPVACLLRTFYFL